MSSFVSIAQAGEPPDKAVGCGVVFAWSDFGFEQPNKTRPRRQNGIPIRRWTALMRVRHTRIAFASKIHPV